MLPPLEQLVESIALGLANQNLYGPGHPIARNADDKAWQQLRDHLHHQGPLEIGLTDEGLLANGEPIPPTRAPSFRHLRNQLEAYNTNVLHLGAGCSHDEFTALLLILNAPKDQRTGKTHNLAERLENAGVRHISVTRATYRRTDEQAAAASGDTASEVAAFLQSFRAASASGPDKPKPAPEPEPLPAPKPEPEPPPPPPPADQASRARGVAAFLSGTDNPEAQTAIRQAAEGRSQDVSAMVSLLISAIMMRKKQENLDGESFVRLIAQSLQQTYDAVASAADGTKASKCIRGIRSGISDWLQKQPPQDGGEAESASAALEKVTAETLQTIETRRTIEGYVNRRRQLSAWEKRLSKLIDRQGPAIQESSLLVQALQSSGLTPNNWETAALPAGMLGASAPAPSGFGEPEPGTALNAMLATLSFSMSGEDGTSRVPPGFEGDLKRIREEIDALIEQTTKKIESLAETIQSLRPPETDDRRKPRSLVDLLAETVQELIQPLSVINSSLDILGGPVAQRLSPEQRHNTLKLAAEGSRRLQTLIEKIGSVSGVPDDLVPRKEWFSLPNETLRELV